MGTTARICKVDEEDRPVFDDAQCAKLDLDDDGFLDLDQNWEPLASMIGSLSPIDFLSEERVGPDDVERLAKVLRPLTWELAVETCEEPEDTDLELLEPYFDQLRALVLAAAKEGSGLRAEFR